MRTDRAGLPPVYAVMAEFDTPDALVEATRAAYARGFRMMEAYTPFPIDDVTDALGFRSNRVPAMVFLGGLAGGAIGYGMQWYSAVVDYPLNVGGRPLHSWPAFIPIAFEMTVLVAAFAAVVGMLALNGLPRPHHPVFNVPGFALASNDRFFLSIQSRDTLFQREETRRFLEGFHPKAISDVPW